MSDRERHILYGITYIGNLKKLNLLKNKSRMVVIRTGVGLIGEKLFKGTNFQLVDK